MTELIPVLIVEDERIILEDILHMIDWQQAGFQVVATAANGRAGCAAYQEHHPLLVIADIQMPIMDGLAMMRQLRHLDEGVSFLILSSYSEFEYAKEAVRLGTDSYLLKTELSPQLLLETLAPIREKIISRNNMRRFTTQHRLFALLSASVEAGADQAPAEEELSQAFYAYLDSNRSREDCRKQLQWLIRECYGVLSVSERSTDCPSSQPEEMLQWMLGEYRRLRRLHHLIFEKKASPVLINACDYIRENYSSNQLKISTVAEHVGLSSSRLSVLFKQEIGKTVNDFITEVRMEAAKELLQSGRYKVYEVAEMTGYKTSQYFSQIFLQYTGSLPTDYQKRGHSS